MTIIKYTAIIVTNKTTTINVVVRSARTSVACDASKVRKNVCGVRAAWYGVSLCVLLVVVVRCGGAVVVVCVVVLFAGQPHYAFRGL